VHRVRPPRERLLEAVLTVGGELGYERLTVRHVLERAEVSRGTFYKHFADKEDCFATAYREASEWLYRRVVGLSLRQPSWRIGLRAGLAELLQLCANQPATAKAIFIEVHAAGGEALALHDDLLGRLAEVVDGARAEPGSRSSPPPTTATFMVGAIETMIRAKLAAGEAARAPGMLPELVHLAVLQYFGEEAAWEDMTSAPIAAWESGRRVAQLS
jgi:AcrR family transcriptional regulator